MNSGGTVLLLANLVVMIAVLLLATRGICRVRGAAREDETDAERVLLKNVVDGQRTIASALISVQADLADIKSRIAAIEARNRDRD